MMGLAEKLDEYVKWNHFTYIVGGVISMGLLLFGLLYNSSTDTVKELRGSDERITSNMLTKEEFLRWREEDKAWRERVFVALDSIDRRLQGRQP